jgi:hypothetical protein
VHPEPEVPKIENKKRVVSAFKEGTKIYGRGNSDLARTGREWMPAAVQLGRESNQNKTDLKRHVPVSRHA